jgi:hypothetical protein
MKQSEIMTASTSINGTAETSAGLSRRLGLTSAIMIVIGSVVGSGIFLTPVNVAAAVQVQGMMMFVCVLTGLLTLVFTYVIFAGWIFFVLGAVAVSIIRKKMRLPPTGRFACQDARECRLHSFLWQRGLS